MADITCWLVSLVTGWLCSLVLSSIFPDAHYLIVNALLNLVQTEHKSALDADFEISYPLAVLPSDIDRGWHMNNAKYIRQLNFSRKYFWRKLGIWQRISELGWTMVVVAQSIRYRRELKLWDRYEIVSRLVCFVDSDYSFYIESKFVKNNFVHAIHWAKYRPIPTNKNKQDAMDPIMRPSQILADCGVSRFERLSVIPLELVSWISANSLSSKRLLLNNSSSSHNLSSQGISSSRVSPPRPHHNI